MVAIGYAFDMDLHFLRDLAQAPGPFATVYLDASHNTEDAARLRGLRWAEQRATLAEQGADPAALDALEAAAGRGAPAVGKAGRVLVASDGRVLLDETLPEPPASPSARWELLPDLLPMLLDRPEPVPAVAVRVDETGGAILVASPGEPPAAATEIDGSEYRVHKVRGGGWSHLKMQERVEESWRRNTAEVAAHVDSAVAATDARVLVIAGDTRSQSRLRDALGERAAQIAVDVESSGGADDEDLIAAIEEAALDVVTADRMRAIERFDQAAGRLDGQAADGIEQVLAALRAEAVDTLLVDGGVTRDSTVWIGAQPAQLATTAEALRAMGIEPVGQARVDAAVLRAAAGTGAHFYAVGGGRTGLTGHPMRDGLGALTRFPVPAGT